MRATATVNAQPRSPVAKAVETDTMHSSVS
jgi:hypothetical protein